MSGPKRLSFALELLPPPEPAGAVAVTPEVDGLSFITLVSRFEERQRFEPAGGYAGLVPSAFDFGDLRSYFLGTAEQQWPARNHLWLLGCDCGELGCWPFEARVTITGDVVTWSDFSQPHRPGRDYLSLGFLEFERTQYERAVAELADRVEAG